MYINHQFLGSWRSLRTSGCQFDKQLLHHTTGIWNLTAVHTSWVIYSLPSIQTNALCTPVTIEPLSCNSDGHLNSIRVVEFPNSVWWSSTTRRTVCLAEECTLSCAYISYVNDTVVGVDFPSQFKVHTCNIGKQLLNRHLNNLLTWSRWRTSCIIIKYNESHHKNSWWCMYIFRAINTWQREH